MNVWAGVDVGGRRKGFDVAVVDSARVVGQPARLPTSQAVVALLRSWQPTVVAVDSPQCAAPDGERSRACERRIARELCGIRYTPDRATLESDNAYYEWIRCGHELYDALLGGPWQVIECFPTASWTRFFGRRGARTRSAWTLSGLAGLGLADVPSRTNQDGRDAIAAAVTARLFSDGGTESFGEIVVPRSTAG